MSRTTELEQRIAKALDRIGRGVGRLKAPTAGAPTQPAPAATSGADPEIAELRAALAKEKATNAQLNERLGSTRHRQETSVTQLERRLARLTEQLDLQSLEMLRLKKANAKLMAANAALRDAQIAGSTESAVLNRSLAAELEALQAERRAEMAEMEEILSELRPLVGTESVAGTSTGTTTETSAGSSHV